MPLNYGNRRVYDPLSPTGGGERGNLLSKVEDNMMFNSQNEKKEE